MTAFGDWLCDHIHWVIFGLWGAGLVYLGFANGVT